LQEEGAIGTVYNARLVYGNGTVQDCIGTWREAGYGVLEDLGSHLIDLTDFLFGHPYGDYILWQASRYESRVLDQCVFATADRKVVLECATTMWKNLFTIDIYGQLGSLHLRGLCKWGPSKLLIHRRVFPSGVPEEVRETVNQEDQTWAADFVEFERRIERRQTSRLSDWRISACLHSLAQQATHLD
jgi:predicted dehydrogenase